MRVVCAAVVEDEAQRSNLCQCVKILGGEPDVLGNTVCVEHDGSVSTVSKFIELFEQYPVHGVSTLSRR